jgi:hypothetical protein
MDSSYLYRSAYATPDYRDISINKLNQSSFNTSFNRSDASMRKRNAYSNTQIYPTVPLTQLPPSASSQNINSWFFSQLSNKQWDATKVIAICSFIAIVITSLIIRFTLWAPIQSISGEFKMILSFTFWIMALLGAALFSFATSFFSVQHIFSPSNESVASADRQESKAAFIIYSGLFLGLIVGFPFITFSNASWNASINTMVLAWISALVAAAKVATENDFRLYFTKDTTIPTWFNVFRAAIANPQKSIQYNAQRTLHVLRYSYGIVIALCLIFPVLRNNFFYLFDPVTAVHISVIILMFLCLSDVVCFAINHLTMNPIEFPLPTPFYFSNIREEVVNLINGMASSSNFVKLFAFRDFCDKAKSPSKTSFFTLSQPGNHPKLWNAVFTNCLEVINNVCQKLTKETESILSKNATNLHYAQFLNGDRSTIKAALLRPPTLKPKMHQTKESIGFINLAPITNKLKPIYDKLQKHFISPKPIIPTVECDIAIFALEGLGSLVECSLTHDKYGIVQKSLSMILSSFVDLASSCDQIIRAKAMRRSSATYADTRIFRIRDIVVNVINDIYTAFERHIDDLHLPADKLVLLKEFTAT